MEANMTVEKIVKVLDNKKAEEESGKSVKKRLIETPFPEEMIKFIKDC